MAEQPAADDTATRPFAAVLQRINSGRTMAELGTKLQDLIAAVESTGRPGKLQLTLTIDPAKNNAHLVTVTADVAAKAPKLPTPSTVFFIDDGHNLRDSDPRQEKLFDLHAVDDPRPAPQPVADPAFTAAATADGAQS